MRHLVVLGLLLLAVLYMFLNPVREHLTAGPPTLGSLQSDTKDLDSRITKLQSEFDDMKKQASEGADAAAAAKLQAGSIKNTGGQQYPTFKIGSK
jgi:predicted  nucleic acid-binding Zn-ribbon protein